MKTYIKDVQLAVGRKIGVKEFAFTLPEGGTGLSDGDWNEAFPEGKEAVLIIDKMWEDEETGIRIIGHAADDLTKTYLTKNAKADDQRIFVSEFDVVWIDA